MKYSVKNLTIQKKLGIAALALGVFAAFGGNPYDNSVNRISNKELALIVERQTDHVSVDELADWIIKGKSDYRLIDLNEEKKFLEYHIPTSENITLPELNNADLLRNDKIILYSDGGIHSAQAWMLMKSKGYKSVYMLTGGLDEWKESVLFPSLPSGYTPEDSLSFEKKKEVSLFFGGVPQSGTNNSEVKPSMQLPKIQPPSGVTPAGPVKKKKKEGC